MAAAPQLTDSAHGILEFASYVRDVCIIENEQRHPYPGQILSPSERQFIEDNALGSDERIITALRGKLDLGMDFYYGVRHQIMSLLNVWDAVLDEKSRYDMEGMLTNSRPFLDASLLCLHIIPARLGVVPLGPFALQSPTARTSFPDLPAMVSDEEIPPAAWPGPGYSVAHGADGRPRTPYPRDEGYYSEGLALSDDEDGPDEAITISSNSREDWDELSDDEEQEPDAAGVASIESDDSDLEDLFWPSDDSEDDGAEVVTPGDTEDHDMVSPQNPGRAMAPASETRAVEAQRPEPSSGRGRLRYPRGGRASPPIVPLKRTFADLQHGGGGGDADEGPFRKMLKSSTQSGERGRRPSRLRLRYSA